MKLMRIYNIVLLFLIIASVFACGCASEVSSLTLADNGKKVQIPYGEILTVQLEGNPTTGYVWETDVLDKDILIQEGKADFLRKSDLIGSPGVQVFKFKAVGKGKTRLEMIYHRPWEKEKEPLKTFFAEVTVR